MNTPKRTARKPTPSRPATKNRGAISVKYLSFTILGLGLLVFGGVLFYVSQMSSKPFPDIASLSHTTEIPDTHELLRRINEERIEAKKPEVVANDKLRSVAEERLKQMVAFQQYAHKTPQGQYYYDLLPEAGYKTTYSCENLDIEHNPDPLSFMRSWLTSGEGHKECMLHDKVKQVGIASGVFGKTDQKIRSNTQYLVVTIFAADPQTD